MKIRGVQQIEIDVTERELAYACFWKAFELLGIEGPYDDAGCDWYTDGEKKIVIGEPDWIVTENNHAAVVMVDAANVFHYGEPLRISQLEDEEQREMERGVLKDCGV